MARRLSHRRHRFMILTRAGVCEWVSSQLNCIGRNLKLLYQLATHSVQASKVGPTSRKIASEDVTQPWARYSTEKLGLA